MDEQQVEHFIQDNNLTEPRICPEDVDEAIVGEDYYVFPHSTVTVCLLTLYNNFTVLGQSACASPGNFNEELGRQLARKNARQKIWPLLGFALRQKLYEAAMEAPPAP